MGLVGFGCPWDGQEENYGKILIEKQAEVELSWVGDEVKVDIIVKVTTCPEWVGWVGGGTNDNNAKSAFQFCFFCRNCMKWKEMNAFCSGSS